MAKYPLLELSSSENVLGTDVTHRCIMGLLLSFHAGNVTSSGEGRVGGLILALCLAGCVFSFIQRFRGGVCEDGTPGVGAELILLDRIVEARLGIGTRSIVSTNVELVR